MSHLCSFRQNLWARGSKMANNTQWSLHRSVEIELDTRSTSTTEPNDSNYGISALPPADGGRQAYLFLAGCFILEATVWGVSIIYR